MKPIEFQKVEITEHHIYKALSKSAGPKNAKVLEHLSRDELRHYKMWKKYSGRDVEPDRFKIFFFSLLSRVFGLTFTIKIMEGGEEAAIKKYSGILKKYPDAKSLVDDETRHEQALIKMIDEEKLNHIGSMVLGINDALVEITGTLAGLTFALQNSSIVGIAGLITGISATLSMAASEYLSKKSEKSEQALKAATYTGTAYMIAVFFLVAPFFIFSNPYAALATAIIDGLIIIFGFTFFTSVVKERSFKKSFLEMAGISTGVALVSFVIGLVARNVLKIDI